MPSEAERRPTKRQIVFNWMMGEDDLTKDGWWGTSGQVESIDRLLAALAAAPSPASLDEAVRLVDEKLREFYRGNVVASPYDAREIIAALAEKGLLR